MKTIITALLILSCSIAVFAQDDEYKHAPVPENTEDSRPAPAPTDVDNEVKVDEDYEARFLGSEYQFVGGQIGLQVGSSTLIEVSPIYGLGFSERFRVGAGPTFTYWTYRDNLDNRVQTTLWGVRGIAEFLLIPTIYAHLELDKQWGKAQDDVVQVKREFPRRLLLGGGYSSAFGEGVEYTLEILYDVLHDDEVDGRDPLVYRASMYFAF